MFLHRWTIFEDIVICSYAMARETDPKTIKKLSLRMGISEGRIAYRMSNFTKLTQGSNPDWHYSTQERKVFDWLNRNPFIKVKTLI